MTDEAEGSSRRDFVHGAVSSALLTAAPTLVMAAGTAPTSPPCLRKSPNSTPTTSSGCRTGSHCPRSRRRTGIIRRAPNTWRSSPRDAGFTGVKIIPTSGKPGVFGRLDAGAKTTARRLFHVRREAIRARGVEFTAARGAPGGKARTRHGMHGSRCRKPEGSAECLPGRPRRLQGQRQEAAGESSAGLRGRRGDRIAALR